MIFPFYLYLSFIKERCIIHWQQESTVEDDEEDKELLTFKSLQYGR